MTVNSLVDLSRPYWPSLMLVSALMILRTIAVLCIPWFGGQFAAGLFSEQFLNVDLILLGIVGLFAVRSTLAYLTDQRLAAISARIVTDLRQKVYCHIQSLPLSFFKESRQGEVLSFAVYEPEELSDYATGTLVGIGPNVFAVLGALAVMASIDVLMAVLVIALIPLFYIGLRVIGRGLRPLAREERDAYGDLVSRVDENLTMMPAIKAYTREEVEAGRHEQNAERLRDIVVKKAGLSAMLNATIQLGAVVGMVVVLRVLGDRLLGGEMSVAEFASFLLYAAFLTGPFSTLAGVWAETQHARGALTRLGELFDTQSEEIASVPAIGPIAGKVVFEDVHMAYPGRPAALSGIDLKIGAGETIALVGPNGAGKSTLVNLIMRFDLPDSGRVLIDDVDVAKVDLRSLREQIALLPQTVLLFHASVRENIAFGLNGASEEMIQDAAKRAQAHDFITCLPDGYDTVIGDRGVRLSGGQGQRVALAQALLKDPAILILDEPTAMFDPEGEEAFIRDAKAAFADKTVILISHRPGSLALADRVVRMGDGRIVDETLVTNATDAIHAANLRGKERA